MNYNLHTLRFHNFHKVMENDTNITKFTPIIFLKGAI